MTGHEYADLIASYIVSNYGSRGAEVYREISIGKSIIGKNRKIDILVLASGKGVVHMLEGSEFAAYCLPEAANLVPTKSTRELDHLLAMHFSRWNVLVAGKKAFALPAQP